MTVSAKIIKDSVSLETGYRITTMELRYPRFIHAEFMTHRIFSRNASSSRAIPILKMIDSIIEDPAMPELWVMDERGMQGFTEADTRVRADAEIQWCQAMTFCVETAQEMLRLNAAR